jgi:hypothetical protein
MFKYNYFYLLFIFLLFTFACNTRNNTVELDSLAIDINEELASINFAEFIDSNVEIISFDNFDIDGNPVFFRTINRLAYHEDQYYILDYISGKNIMVFDSAGKYIRSIGFRGDGPGGYRQPMDFFINAEKIEVLDVGRLLTYNLDGQFTNSRKLESFISEGFVKVDSGYAFIGAGRDTDNLILTNDQLQVNSSFFPYSTRALNLLLINPLYENFDGDIIYRRYMNDTLFQIDGFQRPKPYLYVDFKQNKSNINYLSNADELEKSVLEAENNNSNIFFFSETEDYRYLVFSLKGERWNFIYSRRTDKSKVFRQSKLIDEITFDPGAMPVGVIGDKFVFKANPQNVLAGIESYQGNSPHFQKLKDLSANLDKEGNPVLFLAEFDF